MHIMFLYTHSPSFPITTLWPSHAATQLLGKFCSWPCCVYHRHLKWIFASYLSRLPRESRAISEGCEPPRGTLSLIAPCEVTRYSKDVGLNYLDLISDRYFLWEASGNSWSMKSFTKKMPGLVSVIRTCTRPFTAIMELFLMNWGPNAFNHVNSQCYYYC